MFLVPKANIRITYHSMDPSVICLLKIYCISWAKFVVECTSLLVQDTLPKHKSKEISEMDRRCVAKQSKNHFLRSDRCFCDFFSEKAQVQTRAEQS